MKIALRELHDTGAGWLLWLVALGLVAAGGLSAAAYMEHHGHIVTGMDNQIVWGLPHVFAVFLIVAASGALNVASMASVFGKSDVKPLAPLSGLLAIALLVGGLAVLMLDLGRPDRLVVAMTHYNFKSIFAWNVFLYTGFLAIVIAYLWTMLERRMNVHSAKLGLVAFLWRLALTTGTGSIFGFIVARQAFDSALLAPLFVTLSLAYGLAVFLLVLLVVFKGSGRPLGDAMLQRLARLLAIFVAAGLYFVVVQHLTGLYFTKHHAFERFILVDGGVHTLLFWGGQIVVGGVLPLVLLLKPAPARGAIAAAAALVVAGAFAQMYVTIIGGQAFPLVLFPGLQVTSSFRDGVVNTYAPSLPELLLGLGGIAIAGLIVLVAVRLLAFVPERLDEDSLR
ncbi:NrfD/PsrC family molybdoenzyme membrane anchor subunit [Piscinibacter sp.]|uniref:NrfD/PsrC family molybdoenzyme membrane anchor subunit n=1 Tax=Piscinibacter sp. TaxID=1903157 RepID=UPI00355972A9